MSISRVNGAGWAIGEKLTSAQANALDINATAALDKRSGQTDTLQSVVTCSGAGGILPSYVAGADANTTYLVSGGIGVINAVSGLTATRTYTLSNTGATVGRMCIVLAGSQDVIVKDGSSVTLITLGATNTVLNQSRWAEFIYTGSAWILLRSSLGAQQQRQTFSSNGTYTVPGDTWKLLVIACGGGGGGGGAAGAQSSTAGLSLISSGGGGGGAAMTGVAWVDTTPASTFAVTLGVGGSLGTQGGSGAGAGANGSDGGTTTFGSALSFYGGQGGNGGNGGTSSNPYYAPGGSPVAGQLRGIPLSVANTDQRIVVMPGYGGFGGSYNGLAAAAGSFPTSNMLLAGSGTSTAGTGGTAGAAASTAAGGGGGGGGAASSFGSGGNGGNGGAGVASGGGNVGTNGSTGGTGAGGGGGGAGGNNASATLGGTSGTGGTGGAGCLVVIPIR